MSQARFKKLIPHTEEVTKGEPDALTYRVAHCHHSTECVEYDPECATICVVEDSEDSPLPLKYVPTIITKLIPREAQDKSFVARVEKALEFYSSENAADQLFEKTLVDGTNGKEVAYSLSPHINKDGLAYSRYLVHRAFNTAHLYGDARYIYDIDIIERCSKSRYPQLLTVFIDRLEKLGHSRRSSEDVDIYTCYVRFIFRKSYENVAHRTILFQHLFDIERIHGEFHDAIKECHRNLLLQTANMVYQL